MVDVRGAVRVPGSPCIGTDPVGVVSMALEHLNAMGYPHVAFAGRPGVDFSDARQQAFVQLAGVERGSVYPGETPQPRRQPRIHFDDEYRSPRRMAMQRWLASLPKPVGVVACHDMFGKYLLEACAAAELRVPYDVGVVGVDNDEVICELADPPLSSVAPHVEAMGYDAARTLEAMMNGEPVDPGERLIAPSGVQQRASTDTTAVQDEDLTRAISYIDQHIDAGVNVGQVADHMALSRSSLERRFRDHLNCTPREYILRRRIGRIRQLLRDPHLNVGDVARRCGFRNASHMIALFHAQTGQTPSQYRRGIA
jgi:LacI family transcriptional regulator